MTPDAVKSIGGVCQLAGVVLVVRDLVSIHEYKGDVTQLRKAIGTTLKGAGKRLRTAVTAILSAIDTIRVSRRPSPSAERSVDIFVLDTDALEFPDPYHPSAGQSLVERVAALGELANQLLERTILESQMQDAAIAAQRAQAQQALEAEARRLDDSIARARQALARLEELTVGTTRLRWLGVPLLMVGVAFTTWEKPIAAKWPSWLAGDNLVYLSAGLIALVAVTLGVARMVKPKRQDDGPEGGGPGDGTPPA